MRILIVKLSSIGDVVHTLPAASLLRSAILDARSTWVVERRASEILHGSPVIDELIELDSHGWRKEITDSSTMRDVRSALKRVRGSSGRNGNRSSNIAIDFQG